MSWTIDVDDLPDLARGAALLGTGGGGDPLIGMLLVKAAIEEHGPVTVLDPSEVPIGTLLELARRAAHGVARPAAPVTTFLLGLAVGSGRSDADLEALAERLGALAAQRGSGGAAM